MADWCNNCGLCCMHMRTPPFYGEGDPSWAALPPELRAEIDQWVPLEPGTSPRHDWMVAHDGPVNPCIWLDLVTGRCRHYEHRPDVCREFEVGSTSCRESRFLVGLTCKGMPIVADDAPT
jgi:Fe-S-cluster containining protein